MSDEANLILPKAAVPDAPPQSADVQWAGAERSWKVILFTDIEGSVSLQQRMGMERYAVLLRRHDALFGEAMGLSATGCILKHTGDGFLALFGSPGEAVIVALRFQRLLHREPWPERREVRVRIGMHEGEVIVMPASSHLPGAVGAAVNLAARVMSLAAGGQILMTLPVFDHARQTVAAVPAEEPSERAVLSWVAHGTYLVKGIDEPVGIYEIGVRGDASFHRPADGSEVTRSVSAEEEATLGWRPGTGLDVPRRPAWKLIKRLGEGGFGEVWLAENRQTRDQRVFKFCFDAVRLRSFKREFALFRMIRDQLGARQDIATLHEVSLESPPYYLESEYCTGGTLREWLETHPSPLPVRLELMAQVAHALAAAHSVGVIHRDIKPSNIFVDVRADGTVHSRLADFGIGVLLEGVTRPRLDLPFTENLTMTSSAARTGTGLYCAPEYLIGKPPSIQGDIYSLGVLLYQMVIGDFDRPMGAGWRREVPDALLGDDIAQCVDVEPKRRFSSALLVAERLEAIEARRAEQQAAQEDERRQALHREELARQRKRLRLAVAVSSASICLLAFVLILVAVLERSRQQAVTHAQEMEAARRQMERQKDAAQDRSYVASMVSMTEDMMKNRASATRAMLDGLRAPLGEQDRRGWEWFFADTILNPGQKKVIVSDRPLRAMAVSPDEREVIVAGDEGSISLWSTDSLDRAAGWDSKGGRVNSLSWSPKGLLAAALDDGTLAIWEVAKRHEILRWKAHSKAATSVIWRERDSVLISGGGDGTICQWKAGPDLLGASQCKGPVLSAGLRQDGEEMAAIVGNPLRIVVGRPGDLGEAHQTFLNSNGSAFAWQPGGTNIVLSKDGLPVRLWNPYTDIPLGGLSYAFTPGVTAFAWSALGKTVAIGSIDGTLLLSSPAEPGNMSSLLQGHEGRIAALQWLKRCDRLLSVGDDGTLRAWDEPQRPTEVFATNTPCAVTAAQWNPARDRLAVMLADDEVQVLDGTTRRVLWSRALPRPASLDTPMSNGALAWSPDGQQLAAGCPGRALSLWQAEDGGRSGHIRTVMAEKVSWMPDGKHLLVKDTGGWEMLSLDGASSKIAALPGTEWLVPFEDGRMVSLMTDGEQVYLRTVGAASAPLDVPLPKMNGRITCVAVNARHTAVALGGDNGTVAWFDSRTGQWSRPAMAHAGAVVAVGWNGDGSRLVSAGTDLTCRIYNVGLVAENWLINYAMNPDIAAIGWNARGDKLMIASGAENQIKIYDAARSMDREHGIRPPAAADHRLADACAAIARDPGDGTTWEQFTGLLLASQNEADPAGRDLLVAASRLGEMGLFELPPGSPDESARPPVLKSWHGQALPPALLITQHCVWQQWEQAAALCSQHAGSPAGETWLQLAHAEALSRLGQKAKAEEAWLQAWQAQRRAWVSEAELSPPLSKDPVTASHPSLGPWANINPGEDWTGGEKNCLDLPPIIKQEGFEFAAGPFLQLAGRALRATHEHMFPRITDWIPLGKEARRAAFLVAVSCYSPPNTPKEKTAPGTCVGNLYLRRAGGGAVRVPLLYGRNIWDWWVPSNDQIPPAPPEAVAWQGVNSKARSMHHTLALYRVEWEAGANEAAVTDFSISSTMHRPAPMLMAAEVVR